MPLDSTTFYEESSTLYIKDARKIQLNNKMLAFVIHAAMNVARIVEKKYITRVCSLKLSLPPRPK